MFSQFGPSSRRYKILRVRMTPEQNRVPYPETLRENVFR